MGKDQHSRAVSSNVCPHCPRHVSTCAPSRAGTHYAAYSRSNTCRHSHKPHTKDIREMGGTWSLIWSIGRIPEQIISALVEMKDGITRPGQSHRHRPGSTYRVYTINNRWVHQGKSVSMKEKKKIKKIKCIDGTRMQTRISRNSTTTDICPAGPSQWIKEIWCGRQQHFQSS